MFEMFQIEFYIVSVL